MPAEQDRPEPQALAHWPQLLLSVCRFLHRPEQLVQPGKQAAVQVPLKQTWVAAHFLEHTPQFPASV